MLAEQGISDVAIEASSHGIEQCRLDGLRFAAAGFTNLTRDHLDYHGDMAGYRAAKLRLFDTLLPRGAPVVAMADMEAETFARVARDRGAARAGFPAGARGADRGAPERAGGLSATGSA